MTGYVDSDYVGDLDKRRSLTGLCKLSYVKRREKIILCKKIILHVIDSIPIFTILMNWGIILHASTFWTILYVELFSRLRIHYWLYWLILSRPPLLSSRMLNCLPLMNHSRILFYLSRQLVGSLISLPLHFMLVMFSILVANVEFYFNLCGHA